MENTNIANTEEQVNKTQEQETQETQETKKDIANEEQVNNTQEVEPFKVFKTEELYQQLATFWVEAWKKCLWWVPEKVEKKEEERN